MFCLIYKQNKPHIVLRWPIQLCNDGI